MLSVGNTCATVIYVITLLALCMYHFNTAPTLLLLMSTVGMDRMTSIPLFSVTTYITVDLSLPEHWYTSL